MALRKDLAQVAKEKWPDVPQVKKLISIPEGRCVLLGTVFKESKLRPSVLEEYTKSRSERKNEEISKYVSEDDSLVIEDNHARIPLDFTGVTSEGKLPSVASLPTGIVLAVLGKNNTRNGEFVAEDIVFPGLPPVRENRKIPEDEQYVVLTSGLRIGAVTKQMDLQLMIDYIIGLAGSSIDQNKAAKIAQVIVAGNSVVIEEEEDAEYAHFKKQTKDENDKRVNEGIKNAMQDMDLTFTSLASSVNLIVMPGEDDPTNITLPQNKLPKFFFRSAAAYSTFNCATNPCGIEVNGRVLLGTSGQNIDNLAKYTNADKDIDYLERTLQWRHLAPTAPDTLSCYAFKDGDPFVITECPDIYFAGNQEAFSTKIIEGREGNKVRLVMVPEFSKTSSVVLVNLKNLECKEITFKSTQLKSN